MSITRLYRLLQLITLLRSGRRYDVAGLANDLGVTRRTVFRDLNILSAAGIPYYFDEDTGAYAINQSFFLPPINLTLDEALAMVLAGRKMIGRLPLPLFQQASQAAVKIESSLPKVIQDHCGSILDRLDIVWPAVAEDNTLDETFMKVRTAIERQRKVKLIYESLYDAGNSTPLGQRVDVVLSPYRLVFVHRAWYVIGFSQLHNEVRTFKLSRIVEISVLEEIYITDAEFSIDAYFANAWVMIPEGKQYDVELIFSPMVARNVAEVSWHRTQKCEFLDDGSLRFRVRVNGVREISWWVMGYGDQVCVVKPVELSQMIRRAAENVSRMYDEKGRSTHRGTAKRSKTERKK
jgi:proteasome accessory factor B